jgi:hypothetical protein
MDPAQDYRVHMPATPFDAKNGIQLIGGRNVVLIGGEINLSQVYGSDLGKNNRAIFIKGDATQTVPRTIHIEGLLIGGVLGEGVDIDSLSEPGLTIRFQNIRFNSELQGSYGTNHSDAIQAYNGPCHLEVDKLTAAICAYQGIFLQPFSFGDGPVEEYTFRRMNLTGTSTAGYMLWKSSPTLYDITVDRVWVSPAASKAGQPDQYLWHPQYWTGVQEGAPPGGDFVQVNDVGLNYVSPGYIN